MDENNLPLLSPLRAAVRFTSSTGAGMMRPQGIEAVKKAARRNRGRVASMHADDPAFYWTGTAKGNTQGGMRPRLVKVVR